MFAKREKNKDNVKPCNLRQEKFVLEYLATGNASRSAEIAGYAHPNVQAFRLLENISVKTAIEAKREEMMEDAENKLDRYVSRLEAEADNEKNSDGSRVRALELLIKVVGGFAPERQEVTQFHATFLADLDLDEPEPLDFDDEKSKKINTLN